MDGEESKRLRALLDDAIHRSRRSRRGIERKLGWSQGYLGSLLKGRIALKVSHVFVLARELGLEPLLLFLQVSPPRDPQWFLNQLGAGVPQQLEPEPALAGPAAALTREDVEEIVRTTLLEELSRLGLAAGEEPDAGGAWT